MRLSIFFTIASIIFISVTANNTQLARIALKAAVQLMSSLPDGNFTNLIIIEAVKEESDEIEFEEISTLTAPGNEILTAKKIFLRYICNRKLQNYVSWRLHKN